MLLVASHRAILFSWLALVLSACSSLTSDSSVEYEKATTLRSLDVPPDLVAPAADEEMIIPDSRSRVPTRYSEYADTTERQAPVTAGTVLPVQEDVRVVREGSQRWLVARGTPDQIWSKVRGFWISQGFPIKTEDAKTGILETDWLENRANIPQSGMRALFGKVLDKLYDSSTRDRFRVRIERGETPNNTEVYIAHMGVEEVVKGDGTAWQTRPNDPELEAVMLQRLMVFMGVKEEKAKTMVAVNEQHTDRVRLVTADETSLLRIEEDFPRAWRHVGLALDQVGFTVEDRDRSSGIYYVRYNDPLKSENKEKGFLSRLAFWRGKDTAPSTDQYQIYLQDRGERTEITARTKDGVHDASPTGQRILTLLYERLR
ncbi:Outer membrane protein assembly factor BamC [Gammaproteobacteria bacterium]